MYPLKLATDGVPDPSMPAVFLAYPPVQRGFFVELVDSYEDDSRPLCRRSLVPGYQLGDLVAVLLHFRSASDRAESDTKRHVKRSFSIVDDVRHPQPL